MSNSSMPNTQPQPDYGVLLLAYGPSSYLKAAKILRQCLKIHSPDIPCALATDKYKKQDLKNYFEYIVPIKNKRLGCLQKVYINTYSPFKRTLYLDSNSLILKDISRIFDLFRGNPFTHTSGNLRAINDPLVAQWKNKAALVKCMKYYKINKIHRFNGGLYYFEQCPQADIFFKKAQEIANHPYSKPDDEIIYGITNQLCQIAVVCDGKDVMRTFIGVTDEKICVLKGECAILQKGQWQNIMVLCISSGTLKKFHFIHYVYLREKLKLKFGQNIANFLYNSKMIILFLPWIQISNDYLKKWLWSIVILRPLYNLFKK